MDQKHDMIVVEQEGKYLQVVLVEVGDSDWNNSLNAYMLSEGLAVFPKSLNVDSDLPEEAYDWVDY